jgi:hypothetical protein
MSTPYTYFASTIVEKDAGGTISGRLLHACLTLKAVCQDRRK